MSFNKGFCYCLTNNWVFQYDTVLVNDIYSMPLENISSFVCKQIFQLNMDMMKDFVII